MTNLIDALLKHFPEVPSGKWRRILGVSQSTFSHWKKERRTIPDDIKEVVTFLISADGVEDLARYLAIQDSPAFFSALKCLIESMRTISAVPVLGETIINKVLNQERRNT